MITDHAEYLPFRSHSARMGGKGGEIMSAYIFCPKCSTQCAKGTESCPKCEADLSYPNLYDEYSEYFQSRSFREREGSCYDGIVETQVLDGNRFDWRLMLLSFGAGFLLSIMDTFDDSVFFRLLIGLGVVACVIGAFRAIHTAPRERAELIYNRYGRRLLIAQHMKWDRSTVSNKIHSRLFELGIRDPELFRLLRKLDNIEKVEKGMTEDRPSFF